MEKVIHTIHKATWTRYEKWRVELEIQGQETQVSWLTDSQYSYLKSAFNHTKNGYSDKRATIIAEFDDEKGYYIRCKAIKQKQKINNERCHTPLIDEAGEIDADLHDN